MNTSDLIDIAEDGARKDLEFSIHKDTLLLARSAPSSADMASRRAALVEKDKKHAKLMARSGWITFVLAIIVGIVVFNALPERDGAMEPFIRVLACAVLTAGIAFVITLLFDLVLSLTDVSTQLLIHTPLRETGDCEEALRAIDGAGAFGTRWKELALEQRDELLTLDLVIIRLLGRELKRAHSAALDEEELRCFKASELVACRQLHGIPEPT